MRRTVLVLGLTALILSACTSGSSGNEVSISHASEPSPSFVSSPSPSPVSIPQGIWVGTAHFVYGAGRSTLLWVALASECTKGEQCVWLVYMFADGSTCSYYETYTRTKVDGTLVFLDDPAVDPDVRGCPRDHMTVKPEDGALHYEGFVEGELDNRATLRPVSS